MRLVLTLVMITTLALYIGGCGKHSSGRVHDVSRVSEKEAVHLKMSAEQRRRANLCISYGNRQAEYDVDAPELTYTAAYDLPGSCVRYARECKLTKTGGLDSSKDPRPYINQSEEVVTKDC